MMKKIITVLMIGVVLASPLKAEETGYLFWPIVDTTEIWRSTLENPLAEKVTEFYW